MKKNISAFVILLVVISVSAHAQFRDMEWGASFEDVIEAKGDDYMVASETEDRVVYERRMFDDYVFVSYFFEDNALRSGLMLFPLSVVDRVENALRTKYEEPDKDRGNGYSWWLSDTNIIFVENYEGSVAVSYSDWEYQKEQKTEQAEEDASNF